MLLVMISRKHRFRGHRSLDYIYRRGKTFKTGGMSIKTAPSKGEDYRLAVVVSKKVSKSAVKRNRIRRRLFEQFRKLHQEQNKPIKHDVIITVFKENLATMPSDELKTAFEKLLAGGGIKL